MSLKLKTFEKPYKELADRTCLGSVRIGLLEFFAIKLNIPAWRVYYNISHGAIKGEFTELNYDTELPESREIEAYCLMDWSLVETCEQGRKCTKEEAEMLFGTFEGLEYYTD